MSVSLALSLRHVQVSGTRSEGVAGCRSTAKSIDKKCNDHFASMFLIGKKELMPRKVDDSDTVVRMHHH